MKHDGFYKGPTEEGDRPIVIDGVTYYPMPEVSGCDLCVGNGDCDWLPMGCFESKYIWRTDFEAAVHWAARAERKKETP